MYSSAAENGKIDTWTFTEHPADILRSLLPPPEKSEAEKLVDEWQSCFDSKCTFVDLAQFILDKQNPVDPEPTYVFGPWITWQGGEECPVAGDWVVEIVCRCETIGDHDGMIAEADGYGWQWDDIENPADITRFRVVGGGA